MGSPDAASARPRRPALPVLQALPGFLPPEPRPRPAPPRLRAWPASERPQARFLAQGPAALSDAELLALLLGTGIQGHPAPAIAQSLLAAFGSLSGLASRELPELRAFRGIGPVKAVRLGAAFELARRLRARPNGDRVRLGNPAEVAASFGPRLEDLKKEEFWAALLDSQNRLRKAVRISEGSLTASLVHPREVFRPAILEAAAHLIVVHNHPSGDPTPSREDLQLTRQLAEGARLLGLHLHDHVILGQDGHVSLAERGLL